MKTATSLLCLLLAGGPALAHECWLQPSRCRCAKTWIAGTDAARATRPLGLALEIVPASAPGATERLELAVLYRGRPLAGALVRAWRRPLGAGGTPESPAWRDSVPPVAEARTDHAGRVALRVATPGEWMVNVVHMVPCRERRQADWESSWASLTFAWPERER